MPPVSLSVLMSALCVAALGRAGETYVALLQRAPRPLVALLGRVSSLAGWALFLDAISPPRRTPRAVSPDELEQIAFVRGQLDGLALELDNPDPAARAAAQQRLRALNGLAALLLALVSACAPQLSGDTTQVHVGQGDVAGELEPEHVATVATADEPAKPADPILSLPAHRCVGPWADNSDARTRFVAHPDTGLCAFACAPEHLTICAELGGACAPASNGRAYCGAQP